jgi:hypothetical protein
MAAPIPIISIRTVKDYSCLLPLVIRTVISQTRLRPTIDGIANVSLCPPAGGPASGFTELNAPSGTYDLELVDQSRVDHYRLRITDSNVTITPTAGQFSKFDVSWFHRAPLNSLALQCTLPWGNGGPVLAQQFVCKDVAALLVDSLHASEFAFGSGPGWPFQAIEAGQPPVRYFKYSQPADFGRAYDLLQSYSHRVMARAAANAYVELQNWRGVSISSYRCRPEQVQWCTDSLLRPRP